MLITFGRPFWLALCLSPTHTRASGRRQALSLHYKIQPFTSTAGDGLCITTESDPVLWRLPPSWTEECFLTSLLLLLMSLQWDTELCVLHLPGSLSCRWRTHSPHGPLQYSAVTSSQPQYFALTDFSIFENSIPIALHTNVGRSFRKQICAATALSAQEYLLWERAEPQKPAWVMMLLNLSHGFQRLWQFANSHYESLTLIHFKTHQRYQANSVLREGDLFRVL